MEASLESGMSSRHESLASSIGQEDPPYEPNHEEASLYYYGLPSRPRLVARSSGRRWIHKEHWESHPRLKYLKHVGNHPVVDKWDAEFQDKVVNALSTAEWTSIDVLRLGLEADITGLASELDSRCRVVLWIGVASGSLNWRDGLAIVSACIAIIRSYELLDVECEIRESTVWDLGRAPPLPTYLPSITHTHATAEYRLPLTASPGQPISTEGSTAEGTLGLYLKPGGTNPQNKIIWALTCRHVLHPHESKEEAFRFKPNIGQPRTYVALPGNGCIEQMKSDAKSRLESEIDRLKDAEDALKRCADHEKLAWETEVSNASVMVKDCQEFSEKILPRWQSKESRRFGHVVYGPPLEAADSLDTADACGPRRDWILTEVDQQKFSEPITNAVDIVTGLIGVRMSHQSLIAALHANPESPHKFRMPLDGKMRLQQTVPLSELKRPRTLDRDGDPCLIVGKRGRSTDVTWGYCNEVKSVVSSGGMRTMEWCIVSGIDKRAFTPFSQAGDSGSAIFDVSGRVAGLLTSGTGLTDSTDITYMTAIVWLQQDMKKHGYPVEIL